MTTRRSIIKTAIGSAVAALLPWKRSKGKSGCVQYEVIKNPLPQGTPLFIDGEDITDAAFRTFFAPGVSDKNGIVWYFAHSRKRDGSIVLAESFGKPVELSRTGHIELRPV